MTTLATGLATSFITFSRPGASGAGATVTDRDGKIKWAGHNLLPNSESFDAWTAASATVAANAISAPNGTTTADTITSTGAGGYVLQSYSAISGKLTISVFAKPGTNSSVTLRVAQAGNGYETTFTLSGSGTAGTPTIVGTGGTKSNMTAAISSLANSWYLCSITFDETSLGNLFIMQSASSGTIHLWGAHLYRSDLGGMQLNPAQPAGMQSYYPTTPRNLLGYTEAFNTSWGRGGINGFGTGSTANATLAPNGLQTADLITENTSSATHYIEYPTAFTIASGGVFTFSVYAKTAGRRYLNLNMLSGTASTAWVSVTADLIGGTITSTAAGAAGTHTSSTISDAGNGFYRVSVTGKIGSLTDLVVGYALSDVASPSRGGYAAYSYTGDGTSGIYLWGAQLSDSASLDTYVPQYGAAVTSAAYYAPRLDFDSSGVAKGLLVEDARTNLLLHSNAFDNAAWARNTSDVGVSANAVNGPDGVLSADTISASATTAQHIIYQSVTLANATSYVFSLYVKYNTHRWLVLRSELPTLYASFDLQNGVKGLVSANATSQMVAVGNGWYRISMQFTSTSAGTANFVIGLNNSDALTTENYLGTGTSLYAYGAQIEAGSFSTSLIPTGSATATRTADVASVSTQAFPYSSSASSFIVNFSLMNYTGAGIIASLQANAAKNGLLIYKNAGGMVISGYVDDANASIGTATANAATKAGIAFDGSSNGTVMNGGTVSSVGTTVTAAATKMSIGSEFAGLYQMNGHIRQITYIPRRLSNAELVARTAA